MEDISTAPQKRNRSHIWFIASGLYLYKARYTVLAICFNGEISW